MVAVAVVVFWPPGGTSAPADVAAARSTDTEAVRELRSRLADQRCGSEANVQLGEELLREQDYTGAIAVVAQYQRDCEVDRRVLWVALSAHKALTQWEHALIIADQLVAERPGDMDYWWWRGELQAQLGNTVAAAADYRQSMAVRPNRAAASRLERVRRCQSAFAWSAYARRAADDRLGHRKHARQLLARPACAALSGTGEALLPYPNVEAPMRAAVQVGGVELWAVIDPHAGSSVISPDAFQRVGGTSLPGEISTRLGDTVVVGRPVLLPGVQLQGAAAQQISAVVHHALPADTDLVLGLGFLWRFGHDELAEGTRLAPLFARAAPGHELSP